MAQGAIGGPLKWFFDRLGDDSNTQKIAGLYQTERAQRWRSRKSKLTVRTGWRGYSGISFKRCFVESDFFALSLRGCTLHFFSVLFCPRRALSTTIQLMQQRIATYRHSSKSNSIGATKISFAKNDSLIADCSAGRS